MNGPTKTVGPPWTPLPARKSKGVLEKVLDDADAVIDGNWHFATRARFREGDSIIAGTKLILNPLVLKIWAGKVRAGAELFYRVRTFISAKLGTTSRSSQREAENP